MTDEQIVDVVLAHMQGKKIQYGYSDSWADCQDNHPNWDFSRFNYRVAPEPRKPREFWITPMKYGLCHFSEEPTNDSLWHVREVIE